MHKILQLLIKIKFVLQIRDDLSYGVTVLHRSTHFVALYLWLMGQSGLHAVLWSHIGILMRLPAAEPRSTSGLLFPSQYLSGTIWLTPYLMVWDWRVSRAGPMPFCWPSCSLLFCLQLFSLSLLFLYRLVVLAGDFGLIGCQSPSPGLALPIFLNNNNNNDYLQMSLNNCLILPRLMLGSCTTLHHLLPNYPVHHCYQ